jgi:arginyl-tRNA--protein-N-Asp/Glu arginylyltransferase
MISIGLVYSCTPYRYSRKQKKVIEENLYLDERENIRQRSAERYQLFLPCKTLRVAT